MEIFHKKLGHLFILLSKGPHYHGVTNMMKFIY